MQIHGAVGILFKGDGEQNAVLRIVRGRGGDIAVSLVGYGVAQRVDDHGLVALVNGAGEQIHRLHHVRVPAHDHVKAQIAQLLRHGVLEGIFLDIIFHAPVNEHHGGFRTVGFHLLQNLFRRGVQLAGVVVEEVIHLPHVFYGGKSVEGEGGAVAAVGPGVAHHADLDAVHVHHGVLRLVGVQLGAESGQPLAPDDLDGAGDAGGHGVARVVVGGEQHVIARVHHAVDQRVRTVEGGVALIRVIVAAEGGLQVGDGIVQAGHDILDIAENGAEIIASVALLAGDKHRLVHQQVAHGADGCCGYHVLRLRESGLRGLRLGFRRFCPGSGGKGVNLCLRPDGGLGRFIHQIDAHKDHKTRQRDHDKNQYGQQHRDR